MQRAFLVGEGALPRAAAVLAAVEEMVEAARAADVPVVHLQDDRVRGPERAWDLAVAAAVGERVVHKSVEDGFEGTNLHAVLHDAGIRSIVVCGLFSEMCVASTARSAMARGYRVVLPRCGHATYPIAADGPSGVPVPDEQVSRVAEWSLGDEIHVVEHPADITFARRR